MRFLLLIFLFPIAHAQAASISCAALFLVTAPTAASPEPALIESLASLRLKLDLAQAQGGLSLTTKVLEYDYEKKENEVLKLFEINSGMTRAQLEKKIADVISRLQKNQNHVSKEEAKKRDEQKKEIEDAFITGEKIVFYDIAPGAFMMGEVGSQIPVQITKAFQMAATPTTQMVWRQIAEAAKHWFKTKYDALDADPSRFKGDLNPVEKVSFEDVQLWLEAVSDLSQAGDPIVQGVMPGHKKGDRYRLPTEAEWEFVARARGIANGLYHFGDNEVDLEKHAWYRANSGGQTHPVATKNPLVIDGKEFYDLHGNVCEWTADAYQAGLPGGADPYVNSSAASDRVVRGGSWAGIAAQGSRSADRGSVGPGNRGSGLGFRLVRIPAS